MGLGILKASLTSRSALTDGLGHLLVNLCTENGFIDLGVSKTTLIKL